MPRRTFSQRHGNAGAAAAIRRSFAAMGAVALPLCAIRLAGDRLPLLLAVELRQPLQQSVAVGRPALRLDGAAAVHDAAPEPGFEQAVEAKRPLNEDEAL